MTTYAKYMPYMILMEKRLSDEVKIAIENDQFVAKLADGKFNAQWIDYVLEVTENKALKGTGGIIGLTMKGDTLARWFLARPITAQYSMTFHQEICQGSKRTTSKDSHHSDTEALKRLWNSSVEKMVSMFDTTYINPFATLDTPAHLVNFAAGVIANNTVGKSMLGCLVKDRRWQKSISKSG